MKTIIAGSRNIIDYSLYYTKTAIENSRFEITEIVSGGARGIDWCGEQYAMANNISLKKFLPEWKIYGRGAGVVRNKKMAEYADALIAIWDGKSRGTLDMINQARQKGLKVYVEMVK